MNLYHQLSNRLRKLSICDFALIKWVYLILGFLLAAVYPPLGHLSVWVYLIIALVAALPLFLFTMSFAGSLMEKGKQYLAQNNPSNQVLTLISCVNFGIFLAVLFPVLTGMRWYYYLFLMIILAVKPLKTAFFSGN